MKKRVLSMLMTLALCLTLLPTPAWAAEDTPEGGAIVQQEQQEEAPAEETDTPEIGATVQQEQQEEQEEQQEAPAAESPAILEQAAENGIAAQNGGDSTVENAVAEVTINGSTTPYTDIDAAFAAAQQAGSATVKLLADVTISHDDYSGIALKKGNITLDLNGKALSKSTRDDSGFFARNAVFWLSPPGVTTKDDFLAALKTPVRLIRRHRKRVYGVTPRHARNASERQSGTVIYFAPEADPLRHLPSRRVGSQAHLRLRLSMPPEWQAEPANRTPSVRDD